MSKFLQGFFKPQNPGKVIGDAKNIVYRSSWELKMLMDLDKDPLVLQYSSEEVIVPYIGTDGKRHRYYVDFYVERLLKDGTTSKQLIEIKPYAQTIPPVLTESQRKKPTRGKITAILTYDKNQRKWAAARAYCAKKGWDFIVMTEHELGINRKKF